MDTTSAPDTAFWSAIAAEFNEGNVDEEYKKIARRIADDIGNMKSVIDIATGVGGSALAMAGRVGSITAIDTSHEMLGVARSRAVALNIRNIDFIVRSAEHTDYPDHSFDAAVIFNGLPFMTDPGAALVEAKRILKPGGILLVPTACFGETKELHNRAEAMKREGFPAHNFFTFQTLRGLVCDNGFTETISDMFDKYCGHFKMNMRFAYVAARAA